MIEMMGYSDDVLYLQMDNFNDEMGCFDQEVHVTITDTKHNGGLRAIWRYGVRDGVWSVEVERLGEGQPIPWPVSIGEGDRPYSVRLIIDVPTEDVGVACDLKPMGSDF